jgi:flagellar hook-associated protein 2
MSTSATSSSTGTSSLAISGLASGFDWQSLVSQLVQVQRAPETQLESQQSVLQQQNNALGSIKTELSVLQGDVTTLNDPSFFDSRTAASSDSTLASATAAAGTTAGTYAFNVTQMASAAVLQGTAGAGASLSPTSDVTSLTLSAAGFANPVTAGTFTINGAQITVATTDTLQDVFDNIKNKTGIVASYSATDPNTGARTDQITLTGSSEIVLGSATDTSNFLQVAKLSNNTTNTVTSSGPLGAVKNTGPLAQANFASPLTGKGSFQINGVPINYDAGSDSLADVMNRIDDSAAGVTASYDPTKNQFSLTNKQTGDVGISVQNVSGTFLQATGYVTADNVSSGKLARGSNLLYTVNGSGQFSSQSNTIDGTSSGITGLSVTALTNKPFTVTVAADTSKIKTAITNLVTEYNKVQSVIGTQTASTTDSTGKVTAGLLAGDQDTESMISTLRNLMNGASSNSSGQTLRLDSLGYTSNGTDDSLSTSDTSGLDSALATNLSGLKDLFTNSSSGLAVQLNSFLTGTIGTAGASVDGTVTSTDGSLVTHQANLTKQSADIDTQISNIETQVQAYQTQMTNEFVAMETAEAKTNQQMQFLQQNFGSSSSSSSSG